MRATYMSLRKSPLDSLRDPLASVVPSCISSGRPGRSVRGDTGAGRGARGAVAG